MKIEELRHCPVVTVSPVHRGVRRHHAERIREAVPPILLARVVSAEPW